MTDISGRDGGVERQGSKLQQMDARADRDGKPLHPGGVDRSLSAGVHGTVNAAPGGFTSQEPAEFVVLTSQRLQLDHGKLVSETISTGQDSKRRPSPVTGGQLI